MIKQGLNLNSDNELLYGLRRADVVACYRAFLNREPENEVAINNLIHQAETLENLLKFFLGCNEFLSSQQTYNNVVERYYSDISLPIEIDPPYELMKKMYERIRLQWSRLGETEPHWSVLTSEIFKSGSINSTSEFFFETGLESANLIEAFCARDNVPLPSGICLELGCGVARVTRHLAERFHKVIGVDVSPGNLRIAEKHLRDSSISNVELLCLKEIEEINKLPKFDFLFTVIVLQHNPPPIQKYLLDKLLSKINQGGGFLFQICTEISGYSFNAREYLDEETPIMEVHPLPMNIIFELLEKNGLHIKSVRPDNWLGRYGSNTFHGIKY
jgi:SAM-dependent methyltransferase